MPQQNAISSVAKAGTMGFCAVYLLFFGVFLLFPGIALTATGASHLSDDSPFNSSFFESSNRTMLGIGIFLLILGTVLVLVSISLCFRVKKMSEGVSTQGIIVNRQPVGGGPVITGGYQAPPTTYTTPGVQNPPVQGAYHQQPAAPYPAAPTPYSTQPYPPQPYPSQPYPSQPGAYQQAPYVSDPASVPPPATNPDFMETHPSVPPPAYSESVNEKSALQ